MSIHGRYQKLCTFQSRPPHNCTSKCQPEQLIWLSLFNFFVLQVYKFLEVSCLSFLPEYGPKLKEDNVSVGHLPKIQKERKKRCCSCGLFNCCKSNWQKVLSLLQLCFVFRYLVVVFELFNWLFINRSGLS